MKASELRELGVEELETKLADLKQEYFNLRFQHGTDHHQYTVRFIPCHGQPVLPEYPAYIPCQGYINSEGGRSGNATGA